MNEFPQDASRRLGTSGLETLWSFLRDGSVAVNEHVTLISTGPLKGGVEQVAGGLQMAISQNPPKCRVHTKRLANLLYHDFVLDAVSASHGAMNVHLQGIGNVSFTL